MINYVQGAYVKEKHSSNKFTSLKIKVTLYSRPCKRAVSQNSTPKIQSLERFQNRRDHGHLCLLMTLQNREAKLFTKSREEVLCLGCKGRRPWQAFTLPHRLGHTGASGRFRFKVVGPGILDRCYLILNTGKKLSETLVYVSKDQIKNQPSPNYNYIFNGMV